MNKIEHKEWEENVPFLAAMPKRNPFTVPKGYFNNLNNESLIQFNIGMYEGRPHAGFTVPENYFSALPGRIMADISIAAFQPAETGFIVPDGYFENLAGRILERTSPVKKEARIIRLWSSDLMKYASAACVILITAATLFFNQQQYKLSKPGVAEIYNEQMLYDIDEDTIIEHIQAAKKSENVNTVSDKQLEDYIIDHYSSKEISQSL